MCGILGWVTTQSTVGRARFVRALDTLRHRGPDDGDIFAADGILLGHRRLSIIDLSSAGRQPMEDPALGNVITFNGEIYNYLELRAELEALGHVFRTATDTEVLLHAFRAWGAQALNRLNGMWAFAIWQPATRTLFMARDRFGVKPFYYALTREGLAFASEPKALLQLSPELRRADDATVFRFLSAGELHAGEDTFYEAVKALPAGCYAEFGPDAGAPKIRRYWDYPAPASVVQDTEEAAREFAHLLDDAVRLRTRSDVKVGLTLSGGLDSTAILASAQRLSPQGLRCFTSVYGGNERGEARWAAAAARPYGSVPLEVEAPKQSWLATLLDIAWHMDSPGYSPAVYPLWHLMKAARQQGIYVLLEGQGADEALGGYPQYAALSVLQQLRGVRGFAELSALVRTFRTSAQTFSAPLLFRWLLRELFPVLITANRGLAGAASALDPAFRASMQGRAAPLHPAGSRADGHDLLTVRLLKDHSRNILPALLQYGDAISMAHGVESRLPFMDYRLVEWLFARDAKFKIAEGQTKWLLRRYLSNAGQAEISARKDKQGYPTPVERWMAEGNGRFVRDLLLAPDACIRRYCDSAGLARLIDRHASGRKGSGNHVYRLVSTELWMRRCLSQA